MLIRWSPLTSSRDLAGFQDEVNRLFDSYLTRSPLRNDAPSVFTPSVDIEELPEEFVIRADLPGIDQKDVKVSLLGDTLTIRGERRLDTSAQERNMHRIERHYGLFERSFTLGIPVRNDQVKASYKDGVLEIHVPKSEEARLREIEVKVGS